MTNYLSILFLVMIVGVASLFTISSNTIVAEHINPQAPHFFKDETKSIEHINLGIYYFVPKDKQPYEYAYLIPVLKTVAENLTSFHTSVFLGLSKIKYSLYPQPVIGLHDSIFYNTDNTDRGNPHALEAISTEINARRGNGGDLSASKLADSDFDVVYIIYEGTGASGAAHTALLNRLYLTDTQHENARNGYFAHHFDHTEKEFGLSVRGLTRSWEKLKAEADKCVLVCANCHREIHGGIAEI